MNSKLLEMIFCDRSHSWRSNGFPHAPLELIEKIFEKELLGTE